MLIGNRFGVASFLAFLILAGGATVGFAQPAPETVAKLVAQLSVADFRVRQQASDELEKLGYPVIPALQKAAAANVELEVKRRIDLVVLRIVNAEEKQWQDVPAPRRSIKDRLIKILGKTPTLSDNQMATAIYLLSVGRVPADDEIAEAKKKFAGPKGRREGVLQLTRALVESKECRAEIAAAHVQLVEAQKEILLEKEIAVTVHKLNSQEFQRMIDDIGASVARVVKSDEQVVDLAFLMTVSRYPKEGETKMALDHLKMVPARPVAVANIFWALTNTKEYARTP